MRGEAKKFRMGVFGSRTLKDERVKTIILEKIIELQPTLIITAQEPQGVCEVAQRVCKEYGYPLQLHFLNMIYLRGMIEQRSKEIIAESDYLVIIHDGVSQGTANEKILAKKANKPFYYEILEPTKFDRFVGFNIKDEWDYGSDISMEDIIKHIDKI